MKESSACTSILRLASSAGSEPLLELLLDALAAHFDTNRHDRPSTVSDTPQDPNNDNNDGGSLSLSVSNKYFTADISLRRVEDDDDDEGTNKHPCRDPNPTWKEDGLLLVFPSDPNDDRTIDSSLTPVHASAEQNGRCGDLLRLCIAVSTGDDGGVSVRRGKAYEERFSRNVLWCLDRGYEYVEADLSEEGRARGHDDREKDGFARIVEAVEGTVWSSAVQREVRRVGGGEGSSGGGPEPRSNGVGNGAQNEESEKDAQIISNPKILENTSNTVSATENVNITENEQKGDGIEGRTLLKDESELDGDKQDALLDSFQQAIKEAGRIRDASKANNLSDGLRRKRAGDAASMLMGLLDKIGFDDESEEDCADSSDDEVPR